MSTYRCPSCGHEYDAGLQFCGKCGAPNDPAQRIRQIEQLLKNPAGPASPAAAQPVTAGMPPIPASPFASTPPPEPLSGGSPVMMMQDAPIPAKSGEAVVKKDPNRLIKWIALAVVGLLVLVGIIALVRQATLGPHGSPERLFAAYQKALDNDDGEGLLDLILPEQVERYALDEDTILQSLTTMNNEFEFEDVIVGDKGKIATVIVRMTYTPTFQSSKPNHNVSYLTSIMAQKEKGKWYLDIANIAGGSLLY